MNIALHLRPRLPLLVAVLCVAVSPLHARTKPPTVRWTAGSPACEFQRADDGRYHWRMAGDDVDITLIMDSQELSKSHHRLYHVVAAYLSFTYTGSAKLDFLADTRLEFVLHQHVIQPSLDPDEFASKMQNDVDTLVFDTERQIKKDSAKTEEKTGRAREYEKEVSEFQEFLSTQTLRPATLTPGNPEVHGWALFSTKNKWIGPWKSREEFVLRIWQKDRIYEFPFSLPPAEGDLILRKRDE